MTSLRAAAVLPLIAALALAACSEPASPPDVPASAAPAASQAAPAAAPAAAGETVGGDGSEIVLNALTSEDIEAETLPGELACSFTTSGDEALLLARGNVASSDPAVGVVKVGDYVERVAAPGGFDGMLGGTSFAGRGKTVVIEVTGEPVGGGESPPRPATLTYQRADGASRTIPGQWNCGP